MARHKEFIRDQVLDKAMQLFWERDTMDRLSRTSFSVRDLDVEASMIPLVTNMRSIWLLSTVM
jgi:hypothetical protein